LALLATLDELYERSLLVEPLLSPRAANIGFTVSDLNVELSSRNLAALVEASRANEKATTSSATTSTTTTTTTTTIIVTPAASATTTTTPAVPSTTPGALPQAVSSTDGDNSTKAEPPATLSATNTPTPVV